MTSCYQRHFCQVFVAFTQFQADRLSPAEESLVPFMALEVAAILDDLDLAMLLLESGASASICFAMHLAALKGQWRRSLMSPSWLGSLLLYVRRQPSASSSEDFIFI